MKLKVISVFIWRGRTWQVGEIIPNVEDAIGLRMLREGNVTLEAQNEEATPKQSEPAASSEPLAGDQGPTRAVRSKPHKKKR